jgi:sigma-54 dependent transcriptional regulator, acetoin dehydrogenase operon transcriptional activator AcoR
LRERTDLAAVITKMLHAVSADDGSGMRLSIDDDVMALFERYAWPGNFRQLCNLLRTAAAMVDDDGCIRRQHLPEDFFDEPRANVHRVSEACAPSALASGRLQEVTASVIAAALAQHRGNVSAAARALGISRNTIYRKMPACSSMEQ